MTQRRSALLIGGALIILSSYVSAAQGRITIEKFAVTPTAAEAGEALRVTARITSEGVETAGFVLRTAAPIARADAPPPLSHYNPGRRLAYFPGDEGVHLLDNGAADRDAGTGAFALELPTHGWKDGEYPLVFFAHNRPGSGPHIAEQRDFLVRVENGKVRVTYTDPIAAPLVTALRITPAKVAPGEEVQLEVETEGAELEAIALRQPYYVRPEQAPPPFVFDPATRTSRFSDPGSGLVADNGPIDADADAGSMAIAFGTADWTPGLYFFTVTAQGTNGLKAPDRHVAVKIASPADRLDVSVSESWRIADGTHPDRLARLDNGTLLHTSLYSTDDGETWVRREAGGEGLSATIGSGAAQLSDGRVLGMGYRTHPIEDREGWYLGGRFVSVDGGVTVRGPLPAEFHVPLAKPAHGHAFHPGPLYMRSIVERAGGSLVALMAGWFKGDDVPCPHNPRRPYSRSYVCESADGGETWTYLCTLGYGQIGSEGYNEGSMKRLSDGRFMAVLRTGSMRDAKCQENPVMVCESADEGRTWTVPRRTGVHGAFPDLIEMGDGTLVLSYGRPGAALVFSRDGGATWTDHTIVDPTPYSGYTTIRQTGPGELLMLFGVKNWFNPETGQVENGTRAARVRYAPVSGTRHAAVDALEEAGCRVDTIAGGFLDCGVRSKALGREGRFTVSLPRGYQHGAGTAWPLILFLHGAGRHCRTLLEENATRRALEACSCVVVMPDGGGSWWVDSPVDGDSQYAAFLGEVLERAGAALDVSRDPAHRGIGGWSMGGFGSLNYLIEQPGVFSAWAGIVPLVDFPNPAYPPGDNHSVPAVLGPEAGQFNPLPRVHELQHHRFWFVTAENAFDRRMNEALHARLKERGVAHEFRVTEGGHTFAVVAREFPRLLDWMENQLHDE